MKRAVICLLVVFTFVKIKCAYHRCKPPSQLGGNEHSSKGHGHVEKGVAVGSLPKLVADDALERKIKLKGR